MFCVTAFLNSTSCTYFCHTGSCEWILSAVQVADIANKPVIRYATSCQVVIQWEISCLNDASPSILRAEGSSSWAGKCSRGSTPGEASFSWKVEYLRHKLQYLRKIWRLLPRSPALLAGTISGQAACGIWIGTAWDILLDRTSSTLQAIPDLCSTMNMCTGQLWKTSYSPYILKSGGVCKIAFIPGYFVEASIATSSVSCMWFLSILPCRVPRSSISTQLSYRLSLPPVPPLVFEIMILQLCFIFYGFGSGP